MTRRWRKDRRTGLLLPRGGGVVAPGNGVALYQSAVMDGVNDYPSIAGAPDGTADYVTGAWFRTTSGQNASERVMSMSDGSTSNRVLSYWTGSGTNLMFLVQSGGAIQLLNIDLGAGLSDDLWHLIAFWWDQSAGQFYVSIDGSAWATVGASGITHPVGMTGWAYGTNHYSPSVFTAMRVALSWLTFSPVSSAEIAGYYADPQTYPAAEHVHKMIDGDTWPTLLDSGSAGDWAGTHVGADALTWGAEDYPAAPAP